MRWNWLLFAFALVGASCTAPGQLSINTPQGRAQNYPPFIEDSPARRDAAQEAWQAFLAEFRLPDTKIELEPILNTPRALPLELAGRIYLNARGVAFDELEAKSVLRGFLGRAGGVLGGEGKDNPLNLNNLSLVNFSKEGNLYRVVYRQAGYTFPIENGYGELRLMLGKDGILLQWSSRLIPNVELPTTPVVTAKDLREKLVGKEFSYTTIAGQPQQYKVTDPTEITVRRLVVYPKLEGKRLTIHLAYPVEVGRSLTWTVYVDAINGQELGVRQNFAS